MSYGYFNVKSRWIEIKTNRILKDLNFNNIYVAADIYNSWEKYVHALLEKKSMLFITNLKQKSRKYTLWM